MKKFFITPAIALAASLAFAFTTSAAPLADGLEAYWNMDEGGGTNANEQVHNLDGTLTGGATFASSTIAIGSANAVSYDGVDGYVSVAHDSELDMTGAYSIFAWLNVTDVATYRPILFRGATDADDIEVYIQSGSGDLIVAHNRGNGGTFDFVGFDDPPVGTYFNLVVTFDGTDVKAYYNGVAATVVQGTTAVDAPSDTDKGWWMGKVDHSGFGGTFYFKGLMDEVRIYDRALTTTEVSRLNNYGFTLDLTPATATNPIGTGHTVTVTLDTPLSFIPVLIQNDSAASSVNFFNSGTTPYLYTDGNGQVAFTYTGTNAGVDNIIGCIDVSWFVTGGGACDVPFDEPSDSATKTWTNLSTISGIKYGDVNGNGIKDGADAGIPGWTTFIDLNADKILNGVEVSTTTDATGAYSFIGLADGTYSVCEVIPSNWVQTAPGTPATPACHAVVVSGANVTGKDFGNFNLFSVTGNKYYGATAVGLGNWTIFADANSNGVKDVGEVATTTAPNGTYTLLLAPGAVNICEVVVPGWTQTPLGAASCGTKKGYAETPTSGGSVTAIDFRNTLNVLPPILVKKKDFQATSTIPVKFSSPFDDFSPATLTVCPTGSLTSTSTGCVPAVSSGNSNTGNIFRFVGDQYIFNLSTKMPIFNKGTSYDLWITLSGISPFKFVTITIKP